MFSIEFRSKVADLPAKISKKLARAIKDVRLASSSFAQLVQRQLGTRKLRQAIAARGPLPSGKYRAAVYFADGPVNIYQMRQWYAPMQELNRNQPVVVLTRTPAAASMLLDEAGLDIAYFRSIAEIEEFLEQQKIAVVFYVNQNIRNFQMMRFRDPAHVFISHGESDKDYMASNQLKAYDRVFIAGQAARDRIAKLVLEYDAEAHLVEIGRPQVDVTYEAPNLPSDERTVVLYAPTWEGDRPSMEYSSLLSHGLTMIDRLIETGKHRVIYRPHPRTGAFDPTFRKATHDVIVGKLNAANEKDPSAQHLVDTKTGFGWHLKHADVCICDISAVAFDWLATGKPLFLTEPASTAAEVDLDGLPGMIDMLKAADSSNIVNLVDSALTERAPENYAKIARHYFGDVTPGASMEKWLHGATDLIESRTALWG